MFRKLLLAATLAAGAFAAAPAPASAQGVYIGVGGPGYYHGYDRGPRYRPYRHYGYERPYYRPRPYGFYDGGPRYRPRCRLVTHRYWDGYGYVRRTREICGRRW